MGEVSILLINMSLAGFETCTNKEMYRMVHIIFDGVLYRGPMRPQVGSHRIPGGFSHGIPGGGPSVGLRDLLAFETFGGTLGVGTHSPLGTMGPPGQ